MYIQLILMSLFISINNCQIDFQTICQAGIRQDNTNYIHCGRKQLTEIPNFSRISNTFYDELVLNDNQITKISQNSFQGLRVKRLNLSGNKISSIDLHAFKELANYLEELIIEFDSNILHEIPDAIKLNLINLRSLKILNLNLTILKNHTFIKYRKLEELSIIKSHIKILESNAFSSLTNLRSLHLDQNQLTDSIWFDLTKYLLNLEILTLSQNNIKQLKQINNLSLLKTLKILDLSSNGIEIIEKNFFENFIYLEKLLLQNNELNSLQLTFLTILNQLKELNLDFNRLTFLPENIFQLNSKIFYLSLQGNDLNSLTNQTFQGLHKLTYLNLARNRLQFNFNQQPFEKLNKLEILNLDRNTQLNLSKNSFSGLEYSLIELSIQNCNLTKIELLNNPFNLFKNLQRIKLSSNNLKILPNNFLINSQNSLISIDLQRNFFQTIPNLFSLNFNSSILTDFDLSSNHICTLEKSQLYKYKKLKTIGLNNNPLHCDCHLKWIKQWLIKNYDYDLIKFLQWTCVTPLKFSGKQFTIIDEQDMICKENDYSQCQQNPSLIKILNKVNSVVSKSTSTLSSTTTLTYDELIINDISYNPNGMLLIIWDYFILNIPKYIHLQIYDDNNHEIILQRLIDSEQRSIEIDIKNSLKESSKIYMICLNIRQNKYCRNIQLETKISDINLSQTNKIHLSSTTTTTNQSIQIIYLLIGIFLGIISISIILIIICCWRLRLITTQKENFQKSSIENLPTNTLYHPQPHSSIFYRPLNIISYPQQSQQQSCDTSECSIHSSTDTSQLANDSYHIYQQIPSVYNCQIHPTRTHILI